MSVAPALWATIAKQTQFLAENAALRRLDGEGFSIYRATDKEGKPSHYTITVAIVPAAKAPAKRRPRDQAPRARQKAKAPAK